MEEGEFCIKVNSSNVLNHINVSIQFMCLTSLQSLNYQHLSVSSWQKENIKIYMNMSFIFHRDIDIKYCLPISNMIQFIFH